MGVNMPRGRTFFRLLLVVAVFAVASIPIPAAYASLNVTNPGSLYRLVGIRESAAHMQNARVLLSGVPDDIIPTNSTIWNCSCSTSGCWPGCFTIAAASIMKYWSQKGYPDLWNGDENGILARLRQLFPNMLCYGGSPGKPSDVGYDAFDVATGLSAYIKEHGYRFTLQPIVSPTFEQVVAEIDAGHPIIGSFAESPWGSHAAAIVGYDTTGGRRVMVVRPNLWKKLDMDLQWDVGYKGFGLVTIIPGVTGTAAGSPNALAAPAQPAVTYEVAVGTQDPGFSVQGDWQSLPGAGLSGDARWVQTTDPSNLGPTDDTATASWKPQLPYDGLWEVLAWMPAADTDDSASHTATYRVTHAEGMSLVHRSQHDATQGWMSLGSFPFAKGDKGSVTLGNLTGDMPIRKVWADTVKFVWRAPLLVQSESDASRTYLVQNGKRVRIPDQETFDALRLNRSDIRKLSDLALAQYPDGGMLPSIFTTWIGEYFNNTVLGAPAATVRADPSVNFQWNGAAPAAGMSPQAFSVRWSRRMAFTEGHYPFTLEATGDVRLYVDGELAIDSWGNRAGADIFTQHTREMTLTSGLHLVEIEYANRAGDARITLDSLPPNVPVVIGSTGITLTRAPTVTVSWLDGGSPDGAERSRKFYVSAWRAGGVRSIDSDWITATQWTIPVPEDGHYFWRVSAGNGSAVSDWSPVQEFWVDRRPPWAQMESASASVDSAPRLSTVVESQAVPAGISTTQAVSTPGLAPMQPAVRPFGIRLTWWATDTVSGPASYDVQARELIRAATIYTPAVEMHEVSRIQYGLVLSGGEQITSAVVITALTPYTTVAPLMVYQPLTASPWETAATGLATTQTLFIGNPGSTYEFRVRATDRAGNVQPWYDGYSVQAQMNPDAPVHRTFIPMLLR